MAPEAAKKVSIPRRRKAKVDPLHQVYELDLWLIDSDPPIWRSLAVPANLTLEMLHDIIQAAMKWDESHLPQFETKSRRRFEPKQQVGGVDAIWPMTFGGGGPADDESDVTLRDLFDELKQTLTYLYDFGDSWLHGIKLIDTHADVFAFEHLPRCLAGERAAPLEDSGGLWGYYEKLEILENPDPDDDWHRNVVEWMGGSEFDPYAFDIKGLNRSFASYFGRRPTTPTSRKTRSNAKCRKQKCR